jgi:site-specific DNA-methyltransferase (adenine-specific)
MTTKTKNWPAENVVLKDIDSLIPYARNSRSHSENQIDQIAASIKEWGFTNPVLIDADSTIIAGHARVMAAKKLGIEKIPAMTAVGWTDSQKKAYVIADNKLALNAGWDEEMLSLEIADLKDAGFDIDLTGFETGELTDIFGEEPVEGNTDQDAVPEINGPAKTVKGDIWKLGNHRLMCGESQFIDSIQKLMDGDLASLYMTDPPYNVNYNGKTEDALKIENDNLSDDDFKQFLTDCFVAADTALKTGSVFYIFHADSESWNFRNSVKEAGWKVRQCLIWKKNSLVLGRQDYQWNHEPCLYGWKEGSGHLWTNDRSQTTVLEFDKPTRNNLHPTMKPVDLIEYLIKNSSNPGDLIFDGFGGSGTTLMAAEKNHRKAYLMEMSEKYCDVIIERWQDFTGEKAVHSESGKTYDEMAKK